MDRRTLLLASLSTLAVPATLAASVAQAQSPKSRRHAEARSPHVPEAVAAAVRAFGAQDLGPDGRASCLVIADRAGQHASLAGKALPQPLWRVAHEPDTPLFVGSAVKTFILAAFLRQEEDGKLSRTAQAVIDDSVRSLSSPVFLYLTGRTPFVSVLEAMIAHSDNTATDAAMAAVGPATVRALIKNAGLVKTRIPDSTRSLFGWLAGGEIGADPGWQGLQDIVASPVAAKSRSPLNGGPTMQSTATDLVNWHRTALTGQYFARPETLDEYKRIMAMADALPQAVPKDALAWGKGGSIEWGDFRCHALAGQMLTGNGRATFCFTINWTDPDADKARVFAAYKGAVREILAQTANQQAHHD